MSGILKALFGNVVASFAPIVCLFYRGGWFNTPDDPVSPRGMGEPFMRKLHAKVGPWLADYWWLGFRNKAYGLDYAMKPDHFKNMLCYYIDIGSVKVDQHGPLRIIDIDGYKEYTLALGFFHIIAGYRLRPIYDEFRRQESEPRLIPVRTINMDARPHLSLRWGAKDD